MSDVLDESLTQLEIGGVNLVDKSESHIVISSDDYTYWVAADGLELNTDYTLSVREVILIAGRATGVTWRLIN